MTDIRRPLGTIDLAENDIKLRNYIFDVAKKILKLRGAVQLDTPVIELFNTVDLLYGGEFNKLVYTIDDETDNKLFLRYDLTVPLARYIGMNGLIKFKRYQFGKVYRKDDPQVQKGRYREFYQFDYDIIGDDQGSNINDMEMLETLNEILSELLGKNTFVIKFNYRDVITNILKKCNVPDNLYKTTFSSIDKLDKKDWYDITKELEQKSLSIDIIRSLEKYFMLFKTVDSSIEKTIDNLERHKLLSDAIINNVLTLTTFLKKVNISNFILDPFLVRGMDYYTGIIFEVIYNDKQIMESTIAAGGRYDNMLSKFSTHGSIPAIGMSLGVERITKILEKTKLSDIITTTNIPDIYVASVGNDMSIERMLLCSEFRKMGYYVVTSDLPNPKMRAQFSSVFEDYGGMIPIMIVVGEKEISEGTLTIKDVIKNVQTNMKKHEAFQFIKEKLGK